MTSTGEDIVLVRKRGGEDIRILALTCRPRKMVGFAVLVANLLLYSSKKFHPGGFSLPGPPLGGGTTSHLPSPVRHYRTQNQCVSGFSAMFSDSQIDEEKQSFT